MTHDLTPTELAATAPIGAVLDTPYGTAEVTSAARVIGGMFGGPIRVSVGVVTLGPTGVARSLTLVAPGTAVA